MSNKEIILIGLGETGTPIKQLEEEAGNNVTVVEIDNKPDRPAMETDVMHVCIGYSDKFVSIVLNYIDDYNPALVIIHSTVSPGTTQMINEDTNSSVVHSPIRGVHPNLYEGIKTFVKNVGGDMEACALAQTHMATLGLKCHYMGKSENTEHAKILSTTYYGWNILFAKMTKEICEDHKLDFEEVYKTWNEQYNEGYTALDKTNVTRPILTAPTKDEGLGGHCISSNAVLQHEQLNDILSKMVLSIGFNSDDTYKNKTWLYSEYIGKEKSSIQISKECNVSDVTILNYLKKFNINIRTYIWTKEENNLLYELSQEMTFKEICDNKLLNRSYASIRTQAIKLGIESIYNPAIRDEKTKKKISSTLQNINIKDFRGFTTSENDSIRRSLKYKDWRKQVFENDNWICQNDNCEYCKNKQGTFLHAHHIKSFSKYKDLRFDVDNGITYCVDYHLKSKLHKKLNK